MPIYDSLTNFQKNNTQHPLKSYKYKKSKSSSINQECKFLSKNVYLNVQTQVHVNIDLFYALNFLAFRRQLT